jgi:DNA polymerase IV
MRKIIHFDMDYFFAQVEERDRPELKHTPVAIGGMVKGRGVLCTANYVAREYGVKSAMPTFQALRLCPHLVLIPPNFLKYNEVSQVIYEVFYEYTDQVQIVSCDEAYLDVTGVDKCMGSATLMAKEIKEKILERTGLTGSAGVSCNKLLAKISSELHKPDGLVTMAPDRLERKVRKFPVSYIQGVGKVTDMKMKSMGIHTFGDLQEYTILQLTHHFGSFGPGLYQYSRGIDTREVHTDRERKSLSVENTFGEDLSDLDIIKGRLQGCYEEMHRRLRKHTDRMVIAIFVKIKYADFTQTTIEQKCMIYSFKEFESLFLKRFADRLEPLRLLGLGVRFQSQELHQIEMEFEFAS